MAAGQSREVSTYKVPVSPYRTVLWPTLLLSSNQMFTLLAIFDELNKLDRPTEVESIPVIGTAELAD